MQLTLYSDYTLRVLIYLAVQRDRTVTISEISDYYGISRNHLVKVVHNLATLGYIQTTRGKGGGIRLGADPEQVSIGEIVRKVEPHFEIVECFNSERPRCTVEPLCALKNALWDAKNQFLAVLDRLTLSDAIRRDVQAPLVFHPPPRRTRDGRHK
jgi:Rrf2 family nitric oxide-sensitive transcriptional repressor